MRLYRGKRKDNSEWVKGWYIKTDFAHYIVPAKYVVDWKVFVEVIPESVGQSTGLHDKNGKEDYDGNIWEVEYRGKPHKFLHKKVLDWDGYRFEFECMTGNVSPVHANVSEDGIIIGTIHDKETP